MISTRELNSWRPFAPWSSDLMVEQDYLLSQAVAAIFEDSFLGAQVAMRGGTVLHKGHLAPASRYSEDIDLVLVGSRPKNHIEKALHRVIKARLLDLGEPSESVITKVQLAIRNLVAKSEIIRTTYTYEPTSRDGTLAHLKIEVNINESKSLFPLVDVPVSVPDGQGGVRSVMVKSYDLNEMLGTKLRALLQREHGRDLFDLWQAWIQSSQGRSTFTVDPKKVGEAFRFYMKAEGSSYDATDVKRDISRRMQSTKFLNDMNGFLAAGQSYTPQDAYQGFLAVFLPHL